MTATSHLLRARWIFPVAAPPIEDGVVEIVDGCIARLGSGRDREAVDLGEAAVIPGLVNAHTHLEFSHLPRPLSPAAAFADWVRSVVRSRRTRNVALDESISRGVAESLAEGTTALGEIATADFSADALQTSAVRSTVYREVLGLDEPTILRQQQVVAAHLHRLKTARSQTGDISPCVPGLSPHAPYSVHPHLFRWTLETAREGDLPVAMHLAESREELELLRRGTGPLVEMLREFGLWRDGLFAKGGSVLQYLDALQQLKCVQVVHGNYLSESEMRFLAERPQFSVIYCPRTHARFHHPPHPWRTLLERGVCVALGTDSRASNPDLSLWREVVFLRRSCAELPGEILLQMATRNGAVALGMGAAAGSLAVGRAADLAVVQFGDAGAAGRSDDACSRLLHPDSRMIGTMCGGKWVHRSASRPQR